MPVIDNVGKVSTAPSETTPEPVPESVPESAPEPEPVPAEPETPPAEVETKKQLNEFATKNLAGFPQFSEDKIQEITSQAATNIQGIAAKSNIPAEEIPKAAQLAFYDFTILYGHTSPFPRQTVNLTYEVHVTDK
jgi:hypothetical protein